MPTVDSVSRQSPRSGQGIPESRVRAPAELGVDLLAPPGRPMCHQAAHPVSLGVRAGTLGQISVAAFCPVYLRNATLTDARQTP